jgi:hypothetical protein
VKRDFIIGSMYGLSGLDVEHFEVDRRQLPIVGNAAEALSLARALAFGTNHLLINISAICKQTLSFIIGKRTLALQSGVVLDQLLTLLPSEVAATASIQMIHSLRDDQLARIGRGGLLAMRDAAARSSEAENRVALDRLDAELLRRGRMPSCEVGRTVILGEETGASSLQLAAQRLIESQAIARGKVVIVYPYRPGIDHDLAMSHVEIQLRRSLDRRLWKIVEEAGPSNRIPMDARVLTEPADNRLLHWAQTVVRSWALRAWSQQGIRRGEAA